MNRLDALIPPHYRAGNPAICAIIEVLSSDFFEILVSAANASPKVRDAIAALLAALVEERDMRGTE